MKKITVAYGEDLQAAIDNVEASGGGTVELVPPFIEVPQVIVPKSHVHVNGNGTEIYSHSAPIEMIPNTAYLGLLSVVGKTDIRWTDTIFRYENPMPTMLAYFKDNMNVTFDNCNWWHDGAGIGETIHVDGTDETVFNTGRAYSAFAGGQTLRLGGIVVYLPPPSPNPTFNNYYFESRSGNPADWDSGAANIDDLSRGTFNNCIFKGSDRATALSYGVRVMYAAKSIFNGCTFYSGKTSSGVSSRIAVEAGGATSSIFNNPTVIAEDSVNADIIRAWDISGNAQITVIGGHSEAGRGRPDGYAAYVMGIRENAAPLIQGHVAQPSKLSYGLFYSNADNGRFRPFDTYSYKVMGMVISIDIANQCTLDIGTTPGGHEIAQGIWLSGSQWNISVSNIPVNGYLYATPSSPVNDNDFQIQYVVIPQVTTLVNMSSGNVRINNSTILDW